MIVLAQHDPAWALEYRREADRLTKEFDGMLHALHHIGSTAVLGSTAVPGLLAKPVIDMLAIVPCVTMLDTRCEALRLAQNPRANLDLLPEDLRATVISDARSLQR